jgi:large subunit ribosomal protein L22
MEVRAVAKNVGVSPRKVRLIVDAVRGKKVDEALTILRFMPTPAADLVARAIKSAAANAENNSQMTSGELRIAEIFADAGHTLHRMRPRPRGRSSHILKRSSHITVVVAEEEGR